MRTNEQTGQISETTRLDIERDFLMIRQSLESSQSRKRTFMALSKSCWVRHMFNGKLSVGMTERVAQCLLSLPTCLR